MDLPPTSAPQLYQEKRQEVSGFRESRWMYKNIQTKQRLQMVAEELGEKRSPWFRRMRADLWDSKEGTLVGG